MATVPTTLVGTAVLAIIVGITVPTMIAGTKISLTVVLTTFFEIVVSTNVVGTLYAFSSTVVPTYFVIIQYFCVNIPKMKLLLMFQQV